MKQANAQTAGKASSDLDRRSRLIQDRPLALGASWALDACQDAVSSGRRLEGGWPGTVPEARVRVQRELTRALAEQGLSPLSHAELVVATAGAYERAKRDWQLAAKSRHAALSAAVVSADPRRGERKNS